MTTEPRRAAGDAVADDTRQRLLEAARDGFAESGYRDASVRRICERAGANVSAVKYHFGSKLELYRAVWEDAAERMLGDESMPRLDEAESPADALREFMRWFMHLVLTQNVRQPVAGRLLAHETVNPTEGALEAFVERCAGPIRAELRRIVKAVVGARIAPRRLDDLTNGVIALCVNPNHSREILTRLGFPPPEDARGIRRMADTLAEFALHGLTSFAAPRGDD